MPVSSFEGQQWPNARSSGRLARLSEPFAPRAPRRLAVVDVLLKVGNGLQVLRAGRGRRNDQHIVVLTNYATPDIRRKSIECGADAVFDKSTEIDPFLELCRQYSAE